MKAAAAHRAPPGSRSPARSLFACRLRRRQPLPAGQRRALSLGGARSRAARPRISLLLALQAAALLAAIFLLGRKLFAAGDGARVRSPSWSTSATARRPTHHRRRHAHVDGRRNAPGRQRRGPVRRCRCCSPGPRRRRRSRCSFSPARLLRQALRRALDPRSEARSASRCCWRRTCCVLPLGLPASAAERNLYSLGIEIADADPPPPRAPVDLAPQHRRHAAPHPLAGRRKRRLCRVRTADRAEAGALQAGRFRRERLAGQLQRALEPGDALGRRRARRRAAHRLAGMPSIWGYASKAGYRTR